MKCKLSEFGECENEFTPAKVWAEFCCNEHRKRWHYLTRVRPAILEQAAERARDKLNGVKEYEAGPKLSLGDLSFPQLSTDAQPAQPTVEVHRRKLAVGADR